ncbi:DEAD/DEAH box helicase [Agreia sp. Leaf283]|uniref:DEAD/DEAH box helicase n=1 Tax=Agreia sp. Leaf283 TaxID=1736321 RepID=UPI0009E679AB|nr:DEAD/DEAH box helicase [Agreia sp. Leaf283]
MIVDWLTDTTDRYVIGRAEDGALHQLSGREVWNAEFAQSSPTDRRPSRALSGIRFVQGSVRPRLALVNYESGDSRVALIGRGGREIPSDIQLERGQFVADGQWFSLEPESTTRIVALLTASGLRVGQYLTAAETLSLAMNDLVEEFMTGHPSSDTSRSTPARTYLVNAELFPYQQDGADRISDLVGAGIGALLADEMGLGKTIQILEMLLRQLGLEKGCNLVVCPASLIRNWTKEIDRFAPELNYHVHYGARRSGDPDFLRDYDLVITSFDTVIQDRFLLELVKWNAVIADEAQYIKNPMTARSIAIKALPRRAGIAVSGTPIENEFSDLWSICEFVTPSFLGDQEVFRARFPNQTASASRLAAAILPITIRRTVEEVAGDLPERVDVPTTFDTSAEMALQYNEALKSQDLTSSGAMLATITRLRQITSEPFSMTGPVRHESPKLSRLLDILSEVFRRQDKALVFAPYQSALDQLNATVGATFPLASAAIIDGRVPVSARQSIIDSFNNQDRAGVLFLNPRAAGVGLNLQGATTVVHFAPEWNPAVVAQATARAHRRGQKRPVVVHYFTYADTVESVMAGRLRDKAELSDAVWQALPGAPTNRELALALRVSPRRGGFND